MRPTTPSSRPRKQPRVQPMVSKGVPPSLSGESPSGPPARMRQFTVADDGRLVDEDASLAVRWLLAEMPGVDGRAVDAYLALSKAYWSVWSTFSASCAEFDLSI